jgi:hypothetical protein
MVNPSLPLNSRALSQVVQKLIERVSPERLEFVNSFRGNVYELSTHPYGCRVLQRCFEHLPEDITRPLLEELHKYTANLMQDQFGVSPAFIIPCECSDTFMFRTTSYNLFLSMEPSTIERSLSTNSVARC